MKILFIHSAFLLPDYFDINHPDSHKQALKLFAEYTLNRCDADAIDVKPDHPDVNWSQENDEHFYETEKAMLPYFIQGMVKDKFAFSRLSLGMAPGVKK